MPRNLVTIGNWIFVIKLVILLLCPWRGRAAPSGNDQYYFPPETDKLNFYDSNILPESQEVVRYLLFNRTEKVLFIPSSNNSRIFFIIKPCASAVEWTVSHKSIVSSSTEETEDTSNALDVKGVKPPTRILYNYTGRDLHTFNLESGDMGFYTIDIRPTESDSYVYLYGTTFHRGIYPSLPHDDSVRVRKLKRKSISIEWTSSPEETPFDNIIEYAVAVNRKRSYSTHCSVMSHLFGDKRPRPPKYAGFGFQSETERDRILRENANPIPPVKKGEIVYRYLGRKTRFTFNGARPGRKYIFNVFAFNIKTNRTSAYKSLEVRTKRGKKPLKSLKSSRLKDGRMQLVSFKRPKERITYEYKFKNPVKDLLLAVHACSGKVHVKVSSKNKRHIFKKRVKGFQTFTLKALPKDKYFIQVRNSRKNKGYARIAVTKKPSKFHYPRLPRDTKVKALNITCNNVTIAWKGDTNRQTFCIYKTEISASVRKKRRRSRHDECVVQEQDSNSELVECVNFRRHKSKPLLQKVISGLKPNTVYKIDIHVKRRGKSLINTSLKYESLHIQTLEDGC